MSLELDKAFEDLTSGKGERQANAHEALLAWADEPARREAIAHRAMLLAADDDPEVRGTAFLLLAKTQGSECLLRLERHVDDRAPAARCDLALAGAFIGEPARGMLERLTRDPVFEVRFEAAVALVEQGQVVIEPLLEGVRLAGTRFRALSALQLAADPRCAEPVRALFKKRFFVAPFDRAAAAGVLARLGDAEARRWLVERIGQRRGEDRGLAIEVAGELELREAVESLLACARNRKDLFRGAALRSLGMLREERFAGELAAVLASEAEPLETRMDAAEGLMHLGSPAARAALEKAKAGGGDPELQSVIAEALEELDAGRGGEG